MKSVILFPVALGDLDCRSSDEGAVVGSLNEVPMKPKTPVVKERRGPRRAASFETRAGRRNNPYTSKLTYIFCISCDYK